MVKKSVDYKLYFIVSIVVLVVVVGALLLTNSCSLGSTGNAISGVKTLTISEGTGGTGLIYTSYLCYTMDGRASAGRCCNGPTDGCNGGPDMDLPTCNSIGNSYKTRGGVCNFYANS